VAITASQIFALCFSAFLCTFSEPNLFNERVNCCSPSWCCVGGWGRGVHELSLFRSKARSVSLLEAKKYILTAFVRFQWEQTKKGHIFFIVFRFTIFTYHFLFSPFRGITTKIFASKVIFLPKCYI
jgi:hypothetical protein